MNQRRHGQPSSSNNGPEELSDIGSSGPPVPSVIVFEARTEDTARAELLPEHFTSLVKDLSQEESQLKRRRLKGIDDARNVYDQLSKLEKIDLIQWPSQRFALVPWQELVFIAATIVDNHLGHKEIAAATLTQLHGREVSQHTITKDERAVREIIQLIDQLYLQWGKPGMEPDLALELLMLLDTPLYVLRAQSARKYSRFKKLLQEHTCSPKIRSSFKLYIPFLVLLLRPKYKLLDIQKALGTSLLRETDWDIFWHTSREPPTKYDPIRDAWTKPEPLQPTDLDMTTKETIDGLWREGSGTADLRNEHKNPYHEFSAGTFQSFECAPDCIEVSFRRGNEVIARKTPPGHMTSVPDDITIVVNGGNRGGRAKAW